MFDSLRIVSRAIFAVGISFLLPASQTSPKDISAVFAEGKIKGGEYENSYFGLKLTTERARLTPGFVSSQGKRARLVDVTLDSQDRDLRYTFGVLADSQAENPKVQSAAHYVRLVRQQLEKEGWETVHADSTINISGQQFVEGVMKKRGQEPTYYRGLYTSFLRGYILSFDVTASSPERLREVLKIVRFNSSTN